MAKPVQAERVTASEGASLPAEGNGSGSLLGSLVAVATVAAVAAAKLVAKLWHGLTKDGTMAAFFRQGADELGVALKAFPDSMQVQESGTILNPTQGEIAAGRNGGRLGHSSGSSFYSSYSHSAGPRETWPSEIAKDNHIHDSGPEPGHDHGHSM